MIMYCLKLNNGDPHLFMYKEAAIRRGWAFVYEPEIKPEEVRRCCQKLDKYGLVTFSGRNSWANVRAQEVIEVKE